MHRIQKRIRPSLLARGTPGHGAGQTNPALPSSRGPLANRKGMSRLARRDPSRTTLLRKQFTSDLVRRFERIRSAVWQLVAKQDVFGLVQPKPLTILYDPNQPRDEKGQWTSSERGMLEAWASGHSKQTKLMKSAEFGKAVRKGDVVKKVWRGVYGMEVRDLKKGSVLRLGRHVPTSSSKSVAKDFARFKEYSDTGEAHLVEIEATAYDISRGVGEDWQHQQEAIVPKGTLVRFLGKAPSGRKMTVYRFREEPVKTKVTSFASLAEMPELDLIYEAPSVLTANAPGPQGFQFKTKDEKLKQFNKWFADLVSRDILEVDRQTKPWLSKYVESAYKKGALRAYMDANEVELGKSQDYYLGSREQFLRSAFETPERVSKLRLFGTRAFEELKGITAEMSRQMSRVLADGLAHGKGPYDIARTMSRTITGIESKRAKVLARTEVIHAQAEGQLDGFEDLGVEEVGIQAEWSTAGDDIVCDQCGEMEGEVMTVEEARGRIPLHPNCRCAWVPHLKKRGKE